MAITKGYFLGKKGYTVKVLSPFLYTHSIVLLPLRGTLIEVHLCLMIFL